MADTSQPEVVLDPVLISFAPPNQTPSPNSTKKVNKKSKRSKENEESPSGTTESKKARKPKPDKGTTSVSSEFKRPDWLPEGWTVIERVREGGKTAGLKDKYYYEPGTGKKFRSKVEVRRHLGLLHDPPKPNGRSNSPKAKDGGSSCSSRPDKAPFEEPKNNLASKEIWLAMSHEEFKGDIQRSISKSDMMCSKKQVHLQRRKVQPSTAKPTTNTAEGLSGKAKKKNNATPAPMDKHILESRPQDFQRLYRILEGRPKTEKDIWVPIEKEVFQLPYNAGTVLGFDDMKLMMNRGWLDASIISVFMLHLYKLCSQMEGNRCAFLMPNSIDQGAIKNCHEEVVQYIKHAMMITAEASIQFILTPYLQSEHWSLLLIWPRRSRVYILDPKMSDGKMPETREIYSVLNKAFEQYRGDGGPIDIPSLDLQWEEPKWRQQRDNWECGYYIMKYMHSFVTEHQNKFPNEWFLNDSRSYTLEDVDGIACTCAVICEEYLKNA